MADVACDDRPLTFEDLVAWFDKGSKPKSEWRVGAEHEKFVFRLGSHEPVPYEPPPPEQGGIKALLDGLTRYGWQPVTEAGKVIALERGLANVSLEPGGQFELSGAPLETIHDICEETGQHLQEVNVVADDLGFETCADQAWDVLMYFAKRGERYIDLAGRSFRDFMAGKLAELPGERPSIKDWADHTTTIFPEVRLKQYLEMRGADSGPWSRLCALPALWMGIFYDGAALAAAWDLCKDWRIEDHERLRGDVARIGLKAEIAGRSV